ncbi:cardiolipin synthase [Planctomonas psychrotolerans]|uniref:cardiolipin synthase n=1 Tax=Planctomonas psychrotolerans TaxID=2528712 RepID=UPI001239C4DF|nr:cardiolipin synthase [Planctomonas psychrotolerans]
MDVATITLVLVAVALVVDLTVRVLALIYIPRDRSPTAAMAWLMAIFFLPYIGILLFLVFGSSKLPKRRREKQREINSYILDVTEGMDRVRRDHSWPPWLDSVVQLNRELGSMPLVGGNSVSLLVDYDRTIEAMAEEVRNARRYVHVEFYILAWDTTSAPFFDAMETAVRRGVTVRVLMDHVACRRTPGYRRTTRKLDSIGVQWRLMLPVRPLRGEWQRPDLRNHRKLVVVDGTIAFMGSQNMVHRSYNKVVNRRRELKWIDIMTRLEGPIVTGINAIFITDWYSETDELLTRESEASVPDPTDDDLDCQVVPSGPGFEGENNLRLFNALMYYAQDRIVITSPYFVPDDSMSYAITTAVQRGLHVELFVSEVGDQPLVYHAQRSYYETLLRAGVRINLYKAPYILHAKHFTIDDEVAVVGSSNMDIRSFSLNMEVSLMVRGRSFVAALREVEQSYRESSRELTLEEWDRRPLRARVLDTVARLSSAVQ